MGKYVASSYAIGDPAKGAPLGSGIYLAPFVKHSRDGNVLQVFDGRCLIIRAIRDIDRAEDVRLRTVRSFAVPKIRQEAMVHVGIFKCDCPACTDEKMLAVRHAVIPLNPENPSCPECQVDNSDQIRIRKRLVERMLKAQYLTNETKQNAGRLMNDQEKLKFLTMEINDGQTYLHPTSFLLGIVLMQMAEVQKSMGKVGKAVECMTQALLPMRVHVGQYDKQYTMALGNLWEWMMASDRVEEAVPVAKEMENIMEVVHGNNSSTCLKKHRNFCTAFAKHGVDFGS